VLKDALVQVAGHADIKCAAPARHDVCAAGPLMHAAIVTTGDETGCDAKNKCRSFRCAAAQRQDDSAGDECEAGGSPPTRQ
jgi:hypothetical protein